MASEIGQLIIREAETWKGTPWRRAMSEKGRGADCTGFVGGVLKNLGILYEVPLKHYTKEFWTDPNHDLIAEGIGQAMGLLVPGYEVRAWRAHEEDLEQGDIITISQMKRDDRAVHMLFFHHKVANQIVAIDCRAGDHGGVQIAPINVNWRLKDRYRIVRYP